MHEDVLVAIKTSGTDYDTNDGATLTIQSIQQFARARYRVGASNSVKIGVTNATVAASVLSIEPASLNEGDSGMTDMTFTISVSNPISQILSPTWTITHEGGTNHN